MYSKIFFPKKNKRSGLLVTLQSSNSKSNPVEDFETGSIVETREPSMYKVILLNDDYTPMDFVVHILKSIFRHDDASAEKIMMNVHKQGLGIAGVYTHEVAETKSFQANQLAKANKYPLKTIIEEEDSHAD